MFKAIVIEDEYPARVILKNYLKRYFPESIEVVKEFETIDQPIPFLKKNSVDIIFLDVHLRDGKGTDLLNKLDSSKYKIVFTTAFNEYSLDAFEHKSFGYLLKPLNPLDFKEIVERVIKVLSSTIRVELESKKIKIQTSTGSVWVSTSQIVRCQSINNYTEVYVECSNERFVLTKTLKKVEMEVIADNNFFRCHQSHLINLNYLSIPEIRNNILKLDNGDEIPVSRSKRVLFEQRMSQ
ncbi:MAG: LytTR family DNA-binding domain-containing protein [Crocinitomicaceae bacterium]|nr:LytTR family DNA-binding domain-containing protein [Crocinitomicaceae bacterium]